MEKWGRSDIFKMLKQQDLAFICGVCAEYRVQNDRIFNVGDWMVCKLDIWIWDSEDKFETEY